MNALHAVFFLAVCSVSAKAQFIVPDQQYRCPLMQTAPCRTPVLPSTQQKTTAKGNRYTIHFIEFNDHGELYNNNKGERHLSLELDQALQAIGDAPASGRKTLLMVYVNGWQNNADEPACGQPPCADVAKFRDVLLAHLADEYPAFNVMGIYLAWRGLTFQYEPFKHVISYWPRRAVARHVGQTGMRDALLRMVSTVGMQRDEYFFVLAGHSFGSRVLENAADAFKSGQPKGFMTSYRAQLKSASEPLNRSLAMPEERTHTEAPADLIFYVNAATASTVTRQTIRDVRESCTAHPEGDLCRADPFYLAVTTHADWATGLVMPIANLVFPALRTDGFHLISAANTPWLHTHHDPKRNPATDGSCPVSDESPVAGFCFHVYKNHVRQGDYVVRPKPETESHPFWVFNVGHNVMSGHTDVWNDTVTDMVSHVIARNQRLQALVAAAQKKP